MDLIEDINDATNITGMSKMLNRNNVDASLNAELIEKDMVNKAGSKLTRNVNPDREYMETMRELADISGIPIGDMNMGSVSESRSSGSSDSSEFDSDEFETDEDESEGSSDENDEQFIEKLKKRDTADARGALKPPKIELGGGSKRRQDSVFGRTAVANPGGYNPIAKNVTYQSGGGMHGGGMQQNGGGMYQGSGGGGGGMQQNSGMHQQNDQFNQVLNGYGGQELIDVDKETEEENKTFMLEDIDELMAELQDDDVDLSRIPKVNQDSPIEDVSQVQKILRMKYDRRRYTTFGTEFILAGVHGLEYLFDGKRKWGPYQPDLTNWHNTVRTKLRRMRYETSMIVSETLSAWNIGAFTRVMIELVPSAFLHSRMRSEQHGKAGYSPDQMSDAYDSLRQYDKE